MLFVIDEADNQRKEDRKGIRKEQRNKVLQRRRLATATHSTKDEPVQHEYTATTSHPEVLQPISTNPEVTFKIPVSLPILNDFFEDVSIPSPTTAISTPISIAPCPPISLGISQSPPPIFTDSTNTPTTTVEPPVTVNTSDVGQGIQDSLTILLTFGLKVMTKLLSHENACAFMEKFQSSFEYNIVKANEVISSLGSTLKIEKVKLEEVHTGLLSDHIEFNVNGLLYDIIETCDSMIMVKKHLSEKLGPVFAMLNRLESVPKFGSILKQVGEEDIGVDHLILSFYLKNMKTQYETWSARKIMAVNITGPIETTSFPNATFKVSRGSSSQFCKFTLTDLPCLNLYDWIMLYSFL
ncbi:unnamed protein product [Lactuca saligna]|uniref:Uncharacterized protein n=1 Tax=Lactuca saligna TaxID=75948 RepID=A0AA35YVJ3_LACSI|nr:unnamed protein product [Lactuca saligna]